MNIDFDNNDSSNNTQPKNQNQSQNQSQNELPLEDTFKPTISENNSEKHLQKVRKNIIQNLKKGNDKFIDIKIGDTVIGPLDLTFITILCKYFMTQTGAGIGFGHNKFNINKMVDYNEVFTSDNTTNYDSKIVQNLTNNSLKYSFSPLNLFSEN